MLVVAFGLTGVAGGAVAPPGDARSGDELVDRRTEFSRTWKTTDGRLVTRVSSVPLNWRDQAGALHPFDLALREDAAGRPVGDVGGASVRLPQSLDGPERSTEVIHRGRRISLEIEGAAGEATKRSGVLEFAGALRGVDRRLSLRPGTVKEELVLLSADSPRAFTYRLGLSPGLEPSVAEDGSIAVTDRSGDPVFSIPRAVLWEQESPEMMVAAAPYRLERVGDAEWRLSMDVDSPWLSSARRSFPVVVDPTIVIQAIAPATECAYGVDGQTSPMDWWYGQCVAHDQHFIGQFHGLKYGVKLSNFTFPAGLNDMVITDARLRLAVTGVVGTGHTLSVYRGSKTDSAPELSDGVLDSRLRGNSPPAIASAQLQGAQSLELDLTHEARQWQHWSVPGGEEGVDPSGGIALEIDYDGRRSAPGYAGAIPYCLTANPDPTHCETGLAFIGSGLHADPAMRPAIDLYHTNPAQAGSGITSPVEGRITSRFTELRAEATSLNVTTARFEYIAGDSGDWEPIPLAALRLRSDGTTPASQDIPVANNSSAPLVWDLQSTPGGQLDGPVRVRALLDAGNAVGGGMSPERSFRLDRRNPETSSSIPIGPGAVDLLSGDLVVSETDADISAFLGDLSLTRTYHSRGGPPRTTDMFGPGWTSSFEVDGGAVPYKSIYDFTEIEEAEELVGWALDDSAVEWEYFDLTDLIVPIFETRRWENRFAVLERSDGSRVTFSRDGSTWMPDPESPELSLVEAGTGAARTLTLTDADGGTTVFAPDAAGSPHLRPSSYTQPGSPATAQGKARFEYTVVGGRKRLSRIVAPQVGTATCPASPWPAGCRAIELVWSDVAVGAGTEPRVTTLRLRAVDPSGSVGGDTHDIAHYAYDSAGRLIQVSDPRVSGGLPVGYLYDGAGRMVVYSPPGERLWNFTYATSPGDAGTGRIRSVTRKTPAGTDATTTLVYDVPVAGASAPHALEKAVVEEWDQKDLPLVGTAVFPPDAVPAGSGPPSSWARATIHYLGRHGKVVNTVDPAGNISTTEFDQKGNPIRELSAANRLRALAHATPAARSQELDTQYAYAGNGVDLNSVIGPEHQMRTSGGQSVTARRRTIYTYVGTPPASTGLQGDQHLVASVTTQALKKNAGAPSTVIESEETINSYSRGADHRGWLVRAPMAVTVANGTAQAATTRFTYHATYPLLVEKRRPKAAATDSHALVYHYHGIGAPPSWCASGAGLPNPTAAAGQLCAVLPGAQPSSGNPLTGSYHRYDLLWNPIEVREATTQASVAGAPLRTTVFVRDGIGRLTGELMAGPAGTGREVPPITHAYSTSTGRLVATASAATSSEPARAIARSYDDNGRLVAYTDAAGLVTTREYDLLGRLSAIQDSRGRTEYGYDERDLVEEIDDDGLAGTILVEHDPDGQITSQLLPDGLEARTIYNAAGDPVDRIWERTTGCTQDCVLARSTLDRQAQGRITRHQSTQSDSTFSYDPRGRLQTSAEVRGASCQARGYAYDAHSNRLIDSQGVCGATPTSKINSFDGADRIITAGGYTYDSLGRTAVVPAADSTTGAAMSLAYDLDDLVWIIASGSSSQAVTRDPNRRMLAELSAAPGLPATGTFLHYAGDEDTATGTTASAGWERHIAGADGQLIAVRTQAGTVTWQLSDLQASVVATVPAGQSSPSARTEFGAFGTLSAQSGTTPVRGLVHGWLGTHQRFAALAPGSITHMGARVYLPSTGRFLQVDPIEGGSANAYDYANQDPLNQVDLDGLLPGVSSLGRYWRGRGMVSRRSVRRANPVVVSLRRADGHLVVSVGFNGLSGAVAFGPRGVRFGRGLNTANSPTGFSVTLTSGPLPARGSSTVEAGSCRVLCVIVSLPVHRGRKGRPSASFGVGIRGPFGGGWMTWN